MTTRLHGDWMITYPDELAEWAALITSTPTERWDEAVYQLSVVVERRSKWPPGNFGAVEGLFDAIIKLLPSMIELSQWALVMPDADTITEDLDVEGVDLGPFIFRLVAAERRITALERIEPPLMPTLDSLTMEAQERSEEIARGWLDLLGEMLTLRV